MIRKLIPISSAAWRAVLVLLAVEIAVVSLLRYVVGTEPPPPPIAANAYAQPWLFIHTIAGVIALLVGPLQFVRRIRNRRPHVHRATGLIYIAACGVVAPSGLVLAVGTSAGAVAGVGFAIQALILPVFIGLGWHAILQRRVDSHRAWMLRSWALISAAITLRLLLPASMLLEIDFYSAYPVIAWLAWLINLATVEFLIRRDRVSAPHQAGLAPA